MMADDLDHGFDAQEWHCICEDCFSKRPLYTRERAFTEDMVALTLKGLRPSAAQGRWLMRIHARREVGDETRDI